VLKNTCSDGITGPSAALCRRSIVAETREERQMWSDRRRLVVRGLLALAVIGFAVASTAVDLAVPDGATIYGWAEEFCTKEHRRPGTPEYHWAVDYFVRKLEEFGFEDVKKEPIDMMVWHADEWSLTIDDRGQPVEIPSFWEWQTGFTGPEGVKAPMVYVGLELQPQHDVQGRIVVAELRLRDNHFTYPRDHSFSKNKDIYWQAVDRGAVGVVFIASDPGWPGYNYKRFLPPTFDASERPLPVLMVPRSEGADLRQFAEQQLEAKLVLSGTRKPGVVYNVHAVLPGQSEENIIVSSHLDSGFEGAVEDASGISSVLTQAYTWSRVPLEHRPKTLVFVGAGSHYLPRPLGATTFARDHRDDLMKNNLIVINVEHFASRGYRADGSGLVPTGRMQPMRIHHNGKSDVTVDIIEKVTEEYPPSEIFQVHEGGSTGDTGGYRKAMDEKLHYVYLASAPIYLLTDDDTLDKLDKDWLYKTNLTVSHLIEEFSQQSRETMPIVDGRVRHVDQRIGSEP
jgi:hypothetical protein